MRLFSFVFIFAFTLSFANAQDSKGQPIKEKATVSASVDTIPLRQLDGTVLHILGYGDVFESYTETIDGYTIILNKEGFYEYAGQTKRGDLFPVGIIAKDPDKRTAKENRILKNKPKHLRYTGEKLAEINKKKKEFYQNYNLEIERSND